MTDLIVPDRNEITQWDTARLRSELTRALTLTAAGLAYLATIWNELTRRGEDLSDLRSGLATYLPLIANGTLAAEAVVQFAGQRGLLNRLAHRPIDEQRRLAAGEPVPVVVGDEERMLAARQLTMRQIAIVFDDEGRVRTPIEQRQALAGRPERTRSRLSPSEMRGALAALSDEQVGELARLRGYALVPLCASVGCARPAVTAGMCASHNWRRRREEGAAGA